LSALVNAYKVTGEDKYYQTLLKRMEFYWQWAWNRRVGTDQMNNIICAFQNGYVCKALIDFIGILKPQDERCRQMALSVISGMMDASLQISWLPGLGFPYKTTINPDGTIDSTEDNGISGTGMSSEDICAWLYLQTGFSRWYRDSLRVYERAGFGMPGWVGHYMGRVVTYMDSIGLADTTHPDAITDLTVSADSKLSFTSPGGKGFIVRWHDKRINDTHVNPMNLDTTSQISWWAAMISPSWNVPAAKGTRQTIDLYDVPAGQNVHVMVTVIGDNGLWSVGSNDATATITSTIPSDGVEIKKSPAGKISLTASPNPFNPSVNLRINGLSGIAGAHSGVSLRVYDLSGRCVADLSKVAQRGEAVWNAKGFASGVYVVKAVASGKSLQRKIILVR
jgi:hypothetical protein